MNNELQIALLTPISSTRSAGEDLSYSRLFDEIREARRADDPLLNQGDWETGVKVADWPRVSQLCEQALQRETKDLQIAVWYVEVLTRQHDFAGLSFGLQVLRGLVEQFWATLYPTFDPNDLDERISKFEWLNMQLPSVVRAVPLTSRQHGGYGLHAWQESREVKNLGLKHPQQREAAISEGKLSDEVFDKAVRESGQPYYAELAAALSAARADLTHLEASLDACMGEQSPNMSELRRALIECEEVVKQLLMQWGAVDAKIPNASIMEMPQENEAVVNSASSSVISIGMISSRSDALNALRQVAQYFRINEPHSPVSLLAERAARWGEMPLEAWLASVIKDGATLHQLNDLLDVRRDD
ncbi:MAG: type VI secretion system protein TssA [Formivibrio sp.]|nr:type VI secretion system protein TssA [Formivibrio sp.]